MESRTRIAALMAALPVLWSSACTVIDGECWPRSEDGPGSGAGGGPLVPGGGGFGDAPQPKPLGAGEPPPPPDCLQVPEGACYQKCLSSYAAATEQCSKIENEAQRNVCQASAYTAYMSCWNGCKQAENDCLEMCKENCDKDWEQCRDDCPRGDVNCLAECTEELARCYKKCKERCK